MRDPDVLRRQCADLEAYFRTAWSDPAAYSLAPHGSYITMGGKGATRRQAARFTVAVERAVDAVPLHIRLYAPVGLRQLPVTLRLPIQLVLQSGCTEVDTARALGCSERTLRNRLRQALETIARSLWNDAGQQRLPPRNGRHG